nr:hypothetical protein [Kibdelosporangium sp. MJ126-NF4]CEL15303.1 hypothetical protein [Kibdelosporangium sp. MJ126-NF4]CTQ95655.1 hypothetical protein [Kibdelosporangium sp. MJ126-NF4]
MATPQCEPADLTAGVFGRTKPRPTNGRPYPGTRVRIRQDIRGHRRFGTVALYEWDWNGHLFPVDIEHVGTRLFAAADIEVIESARL